MGRFKVLYSGSACCPRPSVSHRRPRLAPAPSVSARREPLGGSIYAEIRIASSTGTTVVFAHPEGARSKPSEARVHRVGRERCSSRVSLVAQVFPAIVEAMRIQEATAMSRPRISPALFSGLLTLSLSLSACFGGHGGG